MYYTYILESLDGSKRRYIGHTGNLPERLSNHNKGKCVHTRRFGPWKVKMYVAFESKKLAAAFERYLKSGSGHAFAKRHF